jgi:hypothetical protein
VVLHEIFLLGTPNREFFPNLSGSQDTNLPPGNAMMEVAAAKPVSLSGASDRFKS